MVLRRIYAALLAFTFAFLAAMGGEALGAQKQVKITASSLKAAVMESRTYLGHMRDSQKRIFEKEILPQFQRFVRDYRSAPGGVEVDVDLGIMRSYLAFNARKLKDRPKVAVVYDFSKSCERCVKADEYIRKMIVNRLEMRGFEPVVLTTKQLGANSKESLYKRMAARLRNPKENLRAGMVLSWRELAQDPALADDPGHDERFYEVSSFMVAKVKERRDSKEFKVIKTRGKLRIIDTQSVSGSMGRLLTDAFSQIGAQITLVKSGEADRQELQLIINGLRDYKHYMDLREKIENALIEKVPEVETLRKSRIAKNEVVLSFLTSRSAGTIKRYLSRLDIENGKLEIVDTEERKIRLEIQ